MFQNYIFVQFKAKKRELKLEIFFFSIKYVQIIIKW